MHTTTQKTKKKVTAQAMVEFALALPILLLVIYGLLETGRLVFMYASVVTAARQAARYGSASGDNGSGTNYYNDCAGIEGAANRVAFIQQFSNIGVSYDSGPGGTWQQASCPIPNTATGHPTNGDRIRVTVSTQFTPIVPLVPFKPFTITSTDNRTLVTGIAIEVTPGSQGFTGGTELALGKVADKYTYSSVGDVIHYTYTIQNNGTSSLAGPFTITDDKIGTFVCGGAPASLAAGSSYTCNNPQAYTITLADITNASVTNIASSVSDDGTASNNISVTVTFVSVPAITLAKSGVAPTTVAPGQLIQYTFTITNSGNTPLTPPYAISDNLLSSSPVCPQTPNPLPIGGTITCTGSYALKNSDINTGSVTNTATATAKYGAATVTSPSATATVLTPQLFLVLTVSPGSVTAAGQVVTYTYSLTNRTTASMKNINVTDARGASNMACIASLAAGATNTCTHTYTVTGPDFDSPTGYFSNTATATAQGGINSNQAGVNVTLAQLPSITLTKTASPTLTTAGGAFSAGTVITYTYRVYNAGNVTITPTTALPLTVTDSDPRVVMAASCTVKSGSIASKAYLAPDCTGMLTLTDLDIANGSVTSTGTVDATFGSTALKGTSTLTLKTFFDARLSLVKTADKSYFTGQGQTITYSYAIRNTGGQVLNITGNYALSDNKIVGNIACPLAGVKTPVVQLQLGASIPCNTAPYTTTAADVSAGNVINQVSLASGSTSPATNPAPVQLSVYLLVCDASHPQSNPAGAIPDGSNSSWGILNNTGTNLHITGATITWSGGNLQQILLGGQSVWTGNAAPNGIMSLNITGWPALPFTSPTPTTTTMAFKFSAPATGIKLSLTFEEKVGATTCSITSP